jgi:threonine efflux protein
VNALPLLLTLFAVDMAGVATPGPAFIGISQISARHGMWLGMAATFGVVVACWLYCLVVLSGLTVLFQIMPWLYGGLKIVGGLYLIWIGIQFLRGSGHRTEDKSNMGQTPSLAICFRMGLTMGLANPKAMVYFGSIFTLFLHPGDPLWLAAAAIGIVTFDVIVWYGFIGMLFSRPPIRRAYERIRTHIERLAGAVMVAFGARLVLIRD